MFTLVELLNIRRLDTDNGRIKIVRHQHPPWDLSELIRRGQFDIYQWVQSKPIFHECDFVVSFLGIEKTKAKLIGVYRIIDFDYIEKHKWPVDFIFQDMTAGGKFLYHSEKLDQFDDFDNRLVIDWGASPRAWHQWLKAREIVEILPRGYIGEFPGYLELALTYSQLKEMVENSNSNNVWHQKLSVVGAIYLVLDTNTGKQYIGSASGLEGIIGRWRNYVANGHGGNKHLKELVSGDETYVHNFRYSILQTLPRTMTKKEITGYESMYKEKLGSRAFGLNEN